MIMYSCKINSCVTGELKNLHYWLEWNSEVEDRNGEILARDVFRESGLSKHGSGYSGRVVPRSRLGMCSVWVVPRSTARDVFRESGPTKHGSGRVPCEWSHEARHILSTIEIPLLKLHINNN